MGRCFGEKSLVVKVPADLEKLKSVVSSYMEGKAVGRNGNVEVVEGFRKVVIEYWRLISWVEGVSHYQLYPSIRIKEGKVDGAYDTSKLHSDVFAGDPTGVVVMIPLMGDIEGGGVEFYRPTKGSYEDFKFYPDYDLAPDFKPEYLGKMEAGHIHFVDAFCLHKTMLGDRRVSLDHRMVFEEFLESDRKGTRMRNYVPANEWP